MTKMKKIVDRVILVCLLVMSFSLLVYSSYMVILTGKFIKTKAYIDLSVSNFSESLKLLKTHEQYRLLLYVSIAIVVLEILYIVTHKWVVRKLRALALQLKTPRPKADKRMKQESVLLKQVTGLPNQAATLPNQESRQFCTSCGHENKLDTKFCVNCGALMEGKHEN